MIFVAITIIAILLIMPLIDRITEQWERGCSENLTPKTFEPQQPTKQPEPNINQQWEILIKKIFRAPEDLIPEKPSPEPQKPDCALEDTKLYPYKKPIHLPTRTVIKL